MSEQLEFQPLSKAAYKRIQKMINSSFNVDYSELDDNMKEFGLDIVYHYLQFRRVNNMDLVELQFSNTIKIPIPDDNKVKHIYLTKK